MAACGMGTEPRWCVHCGRYCNCFGGFETGLIAWSGRQTIGVPPVPSLFADSPFRTFPDHDLDAFEREGFRVAERRNRMPQVRPVEAPRPWTQSVRAFRGNT